MSDPRLERLRQLDAAGAAGPWRAASSGPFVDSDSGRPIAQVNSLIADTQSPNAALIAAARNIVPWVIRQEKGVLERHVPYDHYPDRCHWCGGRPWPCAEREAALAVLDQIGADDV